jgi:hypothetical protein
VRSGLSFAFQMHDSPLIDFPPPPVTTFGSANSKPKVDTEAILMPKEFAGPFLLNERAGFSSPDVSGLP